MKVDEKNSNKLSRRSLLFLREVISILVWVFILIQIFVCDIWRNIEHLHPTLEVVATYRLLLLIVGFAIFWPLFGTKKFLGFFGYILIYPVILVCWRIPILLFKNWAVIIAFSPAIHSILSSFKVNYILFSVAILSAFFVCLSNFQWAIEGGITVLTLYLCRHFFLRFKIAFRPSSFFGQISEILRKMLASIMESDNVKPVQGDPDSPEFKNEFGQRLVMVYGSVALLSFLAKRVSEVVKSRKMDLYFVGSLAYTVFLTVLVFGFIYFGIYRIDPGSFSGARGDGVWEFFGFSFNSLMTANFSRISPESAVATIFSYFQLVASLLILILLVFVVLTSIRERYRQELDSVINELNFCASELRGVISNNYELTSGAAERLLFELNATLAKWILSLELGKESAGEIASKYEALLKKEEGREKEVDSEGGVAQSD